MSSRIDMKKHPVMRSPQGGFSLMEVLVSMLIVAIALLGIASLIGHSMQATKGGQLRSQAILIAGDIIERMAANNQAAYTGNYNLALGATVTASKNCALQACTAAELATFDLANWRALLAALPAGDASISMAAGANTVTYTIQVRWSERVARTGTTNPSSVSEVATYTTTVTFYDQAAMAS